MKPDLRNLDGDIRALHAAYVQGSGLPIELTMQRRFTWEPLWAKGVTAGDVAVVIGHLKKKLRARRPARQLTFRTFIGDVEAFEEDLAEARAEARVQRPAPGRLTVLAGTGRPGDAIPQPNGRLAAPPPASVSAAEVLLSSAQISAALRKYREEMG